MEQAELNFYINLLQTRIKELFEKSLIFESRIQFQNEIITKQQEKIEELNRSVEDYQVQISNLDAQRIVKNESSITRKRKSTSSTDGGDF